jgi:hypothetical protein
MTEKEKNPVLSHIQNKFAMQMCTKHFNGIKPQDCRMASIPTSRAPRLQI